MAERTQTPCLRTISCVNFTPPPNSEVALGNLVAMGAGTQAGVERLLLEVAKEARRRRDYHVAPLDDLAVAACAAERLAATSLGEVRRMVERNVPRLAVRVDAVEINLSGE